MSQITQDIESVGYKELWELSLANIDLYLMKDGRYFSEMGSLADAVLRFSQILPSDQNSSINFSSSDLMSKFVLFLSNNQPSISENDKIRTMNFFIMFIKRTIQKKKNQNLLDSLHLTVTCLMQVVETKLENYFYLEKIFELLEMLLLGGNKKIQRSIFNFFDKNAGSGEKFFAKIDEILKSFAWRFGSQYQKRKAPDEDDDQDLEQFDINNDTMMSARLNSKN